MDMVTSISVVTEDSFLNDIDGSAGHVVNLYGREKEREALVKVLAQYSNDSNERQDLGNHVVAVHGESGVGKSALVESVREDIFARGGIMAATKLDQVSHTMPFFGVLGIIGDVSDIVNGLEERSDIEEELKRQLGSDWFTLRQLVPSLPGNVSEDADWNPVPMTGFYDTVKRASTKFFETIAQSRPLVLFFDDLQWGDETSLNMIADLATSDTLNTVFILGYRDGYHHVTFMMNHVMESSVSSVDIHLAILDKVNTGALIRGVLSEDTNERIGMNANEGGDIDDLADLIYEKTVGNPFYVLQFLKLVQEKGLLTFSMERKRWEWDSLPTIALLNACSNVLQLIAVRLENISGELRRLLVLSSHLGFEFESDILRLLLSTGDLVSPERVDQVIDEAKQNMLLLQSGSSKLCFTHDQVQQYFYQQVDEGRAKSMLHLDIGRRLSDSCFTGSDSVLFLAVDNMNAGKDYIVDETEQGELAMINREAASRSLSVSMYPSAAHYLKEAIGLLGGDSMWDLDYSLALELNNKLARALCNSGENGDAQQIVEKVLERARSYADKLPAFHTRVRSLGIEGKYEQLCQTTFDILRELGERIPTKPSTLMIVFEVLNTKRLLLGKSDEDLLGMPLMTDPIKLACLEMMCEIIAPLYMLGYEELVAVNILRMLQLSFRYGYCRATPVVLAFVASLEVDLFKNYVNGERLGRLSLRMTEELSFPESVGVCLMLATTFTIPWRTSMRSSTEAFATSARECLKYGEMFFGLLALGSSVTQMMFNSPPLQAMERDARIILKQIKEFTSTGSVLLFTSICLQTCLNLMGKNGAPRVELNGEAITEAQVYEEENDNERNVAVLSLHNAQIMLTCHFRSLDTAVRNLGVLEKAEPRFAANAKAYIPYKFYSALIQIDLASNGKRKRKNLRKVKRTLQWMKKVERVGCSDVTPLRIIVEAEYESYRGKPVGATYENAIAECEARDFANFASIACERAGVVFQDLDSKLSTSYFRRAIKYSKKWGALAKVEWIRETYLNAINDKADMEVVLGIDNVVTTGDEGRIVGDSESTPVSGTSTAVTSTTAS